MASQSAPQAICVRDLPQNVHGRSTERPNGYGMVRRNVWAELITVGTVMRPMVSDMGSRGKVHGPSADPFEPPLQMQLELAAGIGISFRGQPLGAPGAGCRNQISGTATRQTGLLPSG
jgi:hypothetical protein